MTEKQIAVLQGLIDGKSYAEIGRELGTTRQNAFLLARTAVKVRDVANADYYPALRAWIGDNYRSVSEFSAKTGIGYQTIGGMLRHGKTPSYATILRLREITGMSADELMAREPNV